MDNIEGPLLALTIVLMVVGLLGSVVPGLPGVTLIFLSALLYAILTDFQTVGAVVLVILFVLAALAFLIDFFATSYGARRFGASNWGTVGGAIGGIVGALAGLLLPASAPSSASSPAPSQASSSANICAANGTATRKNRKTPTGAAPRGPPAA